MYRDILTTGKIKNYLELTYNLYLKSPAYFLCTFYEPLLNTTQAKYDGQLTYDTPVGELTSLSFRAYKYIKGFEGSGSSRTLNILSDGIRTDAEFSFVIITQNLNVKPNWYLSFEYYDESKVFYVTNVEYASILQNKKLIRITCQPTSYQVDMFLPRVVETLAQIGNIIVPFEVYVAYASLISSFKKLFAYLKKNAILSKQVIYLDDINCYTKSYNRVYNEIVSQLKQLTNKLQIFDVDIFPEFREYDNFTLADFIANKQIELLDRRLNPISNLEIKAKDTYLGSLIDEILDKKTKFENAILKTGER